MIILPAGGCAWRRFLRFGGWGGCLSWVAGGIAWELSPLIITFGVVFLAVLLFAIQLAWSSLIAWRTRSQAREQYGYMIGQYLKITSTEKNARAAMVIAYVGRWKVEGQG